MSVSTNKLPRRQWLITSTTALGVGLLPITSPARAQAAPLELTAQLTEGPFYLANMPGRFDITEGLPGTALELKLRVVDRMNAPLANCKVDIWQCDAQGLYSGYSGQGDDRQTTLVGKTFLRGSQMSKTDGAVSFKTIYPGWYMGRTTHIHFKVWLGENAVLISQFFMPDALNEFLYTQATQYRRNQLRNTLNRTDNIAIRAGNTVLGAVHEMADKYVATLNIVVDPLARPLPWRIGPGGGPPPESMRSPGGPPPGFGSTPALEPLKGAARIDALIPKN